MPTFDTVLRGGTVIDGSAEATPTPADVGVRDGRIVAIGDLDVAGQEARDVVDVGGRVVAPGFIDPHTHIEPAVLAGRDDVDLPVVQGVTTCLLGADGFGWAPLWPEDARRLWAASAGIQGPMPDGVSTSSVDAYLASFGGRLPFHVLPQVPHHALRFAAMGWPDGVAGPAALDEMLERAREWMGAGATGLSVGLDYEPGARAVTAELDVLCRSVAREDGSLSAHIRYEDIGREAAWQEVIGIAERTGVRLRIAHERLDEIGAAAIERARDRIDVHLETYPYEAASTHLAMYVRAPDRVGGPAAIAGRLQDAAFERRIAAQLNDVLGAEVAAGDRFVIAASSDPGRIGADLAEAAAADRRSLGEVAARLLRDDPDALFVIHHDRPTGPSITWRTLAHPATLVASDGVYVPGQIHPRGAGTFPRVLRAAIDDVLGLDLAQAIHAMTGRTATAYRVPDRGRLVAGAVADVVVLDPTVVRDGATFGSPRTRPTGIEHVLVAGRFTVRDGAVTGQRPGVMLAAGAPA